MLNWQHEIQKAHKRIQAQVERTLAIPADVQKVLKTSTAKRAKVEKAERKTTCLADVGCEKAISTKYVKDLTANTWQATRTKRNYDANAKDKHHPVASVKVSPKNNAKMWQFAMA